MTPVKDPGFHRCEITFRLNKLQDGKNPNEPDMVIKDYETGHFFRVDAGSVEALVPSIERFLADIQAIRAEAAAKAAGK